MKAIYPTISYNSKIKDCRTLGDPTANPELIIQISTTVRRKAIGGFYYYVEVIESNAFPVDPDDPTHSKVISQSFGRFIQNVYQTQLNHVYTEQLDEFDTPLYFVDRDYTTEEQRIKKLYNI